MLAYHVQTVKMDTVVFTVLTKVDLTLAYTKEEYKEKLQEEYPEAEDVYTISEFLQMNKEVEPVFGEPLTSYGKCYEMLENMISGIVVKLNEEELKR